MQSRKTALLGLAAIVALLSVACSSSKKSSTSTGASTTVGASATSTAPVSLADAQANAAKYAAVPTQIVQTEALPSKPPKKKVGFMVCANPNCVELAKYLKDATDTLGWSLTTVNAPATDPGSAIQQLIDSGVDYVAETGSDVKQFQTQAAELKSKNIPLFECYATDVPGGPANGIYSDCNDAAASKVNARALSDWIISDAGGKAHTLVVSLPAFPILSAQVDAVHAAFTQDCPACKTSDLAVTIADLSSGAVPQSIASYLQTHTDINYLYLAFNGLNGSVAKTLQSAGLLSKIKVVGTQPGSPELQNIIDGTEKAWLSLPQNSTMWTLADQMARLSVNQWSLSQERKASVAPQFIVTTPDQAKALMGYKLGWPGPTGYQDAFKALWKV